MMQKHPPGRFDDAHSCASPPAKLKRASTPTAAVEDGDYRQSDFHLKTIPDVPYKTGLAITIFHHEPPEPFGCEYDTARPPEHPGWKEMSQIDYCLSRPPLKGRTDPNVRKCFAITETIRTGQQKGAQLVVVDGTMVAKIYDPLYYRGVHEYGGPNDVVSGADADYCREAAAYEELQKSPEALAVIPAYYGTWNMDVATPVMRSPHKRLKYTRSVRMILIERLWGDCMFNLDPHSLREEVRSMIVKKAIIAETLLRGAGIKHGDVAARNIMVIGTDYKSPDALAYDVHLEVKLYDFNITTVITHPRYAYHKYLDILEARKKKWPSKLSSPIITHYGQMLDFSTTGWCPDGPDWEAEQWLWQHFRADDRFIPVTWDPAKPDDRPAYKEPSDIQHDTESSSDSGIDFSSDSMEGSDYCNGSSSDDARTGEDVTVENNSDVHLGRRESEGPTVGNKSCNMPLQVYVNFDQ